ncbi:MAG: bifunctional diaminohydroxyphosphoribosylaminopyrimidine deaminase/5-amino-6-(5-phosphoribosylamino)uracil reductase RibD [Muribaculaceae bacterium]|nr:bifunctional diaminohydroxyphosphoribosylaminopyrimidine deaminase/5-amino-6-(5-phosphoribosylamino)uracil reductase RibD [Muribaculaceae bacterium]
MNYDEKYMRRAIQLARNGMMFASPNPMVGAVIVHNDKIIGEGFHHKCGEGHAEVNAVASVTQPELLAHSTIYVTLEPCSHYGKTPPCAQLIIDKKIPRVVIGSLDPFEKVSGRGVKMLKEAGIEVVHGILDDDCQQLNTKFITAHTLHRPFVTLKWAQSADGYIDHIRTESTPHAARFSTPQSSALVHKLRATHNAIMVGANTVINDNPTLDCRLWHGNSPIRVVLDRQGIVSVNSKLLTDNPQRTIYFTSVERKEISPLVTQIIINHDTPLSEILTILYKRNITSVLIEGGATLLQNAVDNNLWDIARVETAPFSLDNNGCVKAPSINTTPTSTQHIGNNIIEIHNHN